MIRPAFSWLRLPLPALAFGVLSIVAMSVGASEFSVSPIGIELKPGALNETISVTNHASARLRVGMRLMEWTQDAQGADVYKDTGDLVYFPRQMEIAPEAKRLVRVGAKSVAGESERAYRLFIEEQPEAATGPERSQVSFYLRFSVPVFIPPAVRRPQVEVGEPQLAQGKVSLTVRNRGNQHVRIVRMLVQDEAGEAREATGWYQLPGIDRTYSVEIPQATCRTAKTLRITVEGEGLKAVRDLHVDPARCL
ncbi:MAG TPA: fimbria/pilus periplasmic chaperone [Ramlibacter sp.]|uniref:fimbrial biogenesis chaperone n=1 Tax=Ramlibacter sp. TaxID=1917967 RepID=UPI002D7E66EC|nr:fimbria/pilus periplasmic chaperone [Ramlibacter sp.]HET8745746.1 fimbria/pilus periplasmic chaperone [Ramlibacter sp.]